MIILFLNRLGGIWVVMERLDDPKRFEGEHRAVRLRSFHFQWWLTGPLTPLSHTNTMAFPLQHPPTPNSISWYTHSKILIILGSFFRRSAVSLVSTSPRKCFLFGMTSLENILDWDLCTTIPRRWMFSKGLDEVLCPRIMASTLQMKGRWLGQYKCLVLIYVFPEMKLYRFVISKTEL